MISSPLHSAALPANLSQGYLACVAGEPSGDMLAASVLAGMKDLRRLLIYQRVVSVALR